MAGDTEGSSRNRLIALCAAAYVGAIGFSVVGLMRDPPLKSYVITPGGDWTRCVEITATSERLANREALRRPTPARVKDDDCPVLPAIKAVDSRLMVERGVNAARIVSALQAARWGIGVALRAWRRGDDPFD
jgi:hypothetical protein